MGFSESIVVVLIALAAAVVVIWPASRICRRAGYSPYLGFVAVVPIANIALLWFIALSPWSSNRNPGTVP